MNQDKETVRMSETRNGTWSLFVDDSLILRTTNKRIVERYFALFTSEKWKGPRIIVPANPKKPDEKN